MSLRNLSAFALYCLACIWLPFSDAQSSTSASLLGTIPAKQASQGLGFNLDPAQDWQWAAAAAAGATYARIQCAWSVVEQQTAPPLNASASTRYVEDPKCKAGFASAKKYGMKVTVVAAYGPPSHEILNVSIPAGAPKGATSLVLQYESGIGGETLDNIVFPYDYLCAMNQASPGQCSAPITARHSYQGSLITGMTKIDATHATISLASALTRDLPADSTPYLVEEILYPSADTEQAASPSVQAYADYVSFLAQDMAAAGITGDIEIWNEPPWSNDPWDQRSALYDPGTYTGSSEFGANFGFAANIMNRTFPAGITATWNGTSGTSNGSLLTSFMKKYSGVALIEPSTTITKESYHPYSSKTGNPEDDMFQTNCLQLEIGSNHPLNCSLPGTAGSSNLWQSILYSMRQQAIHPSFGLGHSITETNQYPPAAGMQQKQAQAIVRQFLGFEADGITPIEFFKLCNGPAADPTFNFVQTSACTSSSYTPTPAFTALAGVVSDLAQISQDPVQDLSTAMLPTVSSYLGTYGLATANMVGARPGAQANSDAFMVWQVSACTTANCWFTLASPDAAPVQIQLPADTKVTAVVDLITRAPVSYSVSGQQVTFNVSDDPIEVLIDPASYTLSKTSLNVSATPASVTYGDHVVLSAVLSPSTSGQNSSDGETVQFYNDSGVLGTGKLSSGTATLDLTTLQAGVQHVYASYTGDQQLAASSGSSTVSVAKAAPSLTLPTIATQAVGGSLFNVLATTNSAATVSYAVVSGPAWISSQSAAGAMLKGIGVGSATLQATQPETANYLAATVQANFQIQGEDPSLTFTTIATKLYNASTPFVVQASSRSSAAVTYSVVSGPATVSGNVVTLTGAGTVVLMANQAALGTYAAATSQTSFLVNSQTGTNLVLPSVGTQVMGAPLFNVQATSNSPAVISYQVVSGPAWISSSTSAGAMIKLTGVGTVVFQAHQGATGLFAAATSQITFTVLGEDPSLTFDAIATKLYKVSAPFTIRAGTRSPTTVTYSVVGGPATVVGNVVTLTGSGTVVLQASQAGNGTYAAATTQISFQVNAQIVTALRLPNIGAQIFGGGLFGVLATSNSPAPIAYKVVSGPAWISTSTAAGATVKPLGLGVVTFQATQNATGNYAAAKSQVSFVVVSSDADLEVQ